MGKTEPAEIAKEYLAYLKKEKIVCDKAIVVLFGDNIKVSLGKFDKLEIVVVYKDFGQNIIAQQQALIAATWYVDPRIVPFGASVQEWATSIESSKLARAKSTGIEISD